MIVSTLQAIDLLTRGHVVALPTETVYGLAASLQHHQAIEQIFLLKGRPVNNPLIIHVASFAQAACYANELPNGFEELTQEFWPGPMTLVLPINVDAVPSIVRAGLTTAAFRMPAHQQTLKVIAETGPLVMPSANLSGKPSSTSAQHVQHDFGLDFPVMDGGDCNCGLESTILTYIEDSWKVIRLGALPPERFFRALGYTPEVLIKTNGQTPLCPGQMFRHYSPNARLKLVYRLPGDAKGVVLGFSDRHYPKDCDLWPLGSSLEPENVCANLYAFLRKLDEKNIQEAWVDINFPVEGLWMTVLERLQKAAV